MEYVGIDYFFDNSKRIYIGYLLSSLLLALIFFWNRKIVLKRQFSKDILLHPSAKLDYIYFIIVSAIKILVILPLFISVSVVTLWIVLKFQEIFGYQERIKVDRELLLLLYSITLFLVNDFSRYWLHRFLHLSSLLWRFHRVHHSAEVLNPLTFYRVHIIENILFGIRYALVTGLITALFIYYFGAGIKAIEIVGVNLLTMLFMLIGSNLRHSHIPLRFGDKIEKWIISPFQHQLHHSKEYTHTNFGSSLAIWDRFFGTLVIKKEKTLCFGLPNETSTHSLLGALINPFYKGIKL